MSASAEEIRTWSKGNQLKDALAIIDKMESVLLMVKEELCFGGDWENAKKQIDKVLGNES